MMTAAMLAVAMLAPGSAGGLVSAQVTPTTTPRVLPKNVDKAIEEDISFDVAGKRLEETVQAFRDASQTNIAVNWAALALAGITRDTPVTLHLKKLPCEQVLRCLMEVLPTDKTRPNFTVGDNAIEITTTAAMGKLAVPKLYSIARASSTTVDGVKPTPEQIATTSDLIQKTIHKLLLNVHEEADAPGRNLIARDQYLAATQSKRAQIYVQQAISAFDTPTKLHQVPRGMVASVREKKAAERLNAMKVTLSNLAANPAMDPELNVILLPGAAAEIAKGPAAKLDFLITDGGVVEVGSADEIAGRVTLAVYDLHDVIRRMTLKAKKPALSPAELADSIVAAVKEKVHPYHDADIAWGDLEKSFGSMTLCEGLLIVFAPVSAHRAIAARLEELAR